MNIRQRVAAVNKINNFVIPKTKAENEQCTSTASFVSAQLKLTGIPQSITDEIYNEAKGIVENGSVLKGFGNLFYVQNRADQNKPFQIIISDNGNGSCKGATCPRFISFKVCQHILAVTIEQQILNKFISVYNSKENVQLINTVNIGKEKSAGRKKTKSTQKRKGPANQKQVEVKRVVLPCDDMTAKSALSEPAPNQYILSILKICHRNVSKCYGCGGAFYEKGYPQEPNDLAVVTKLRRQFVDPKTKVPTTSSKFSKVYFHFNGTCIRRYNSCFVPQLVEVAENLKSLFSDMHKIFLHALGIYL